MPSKPERFGKYELIERIAKGGMGETYLADLNAVAGVTKRVVIKKMLPQLASDPQLVEAFVQEARISATLSHGNIAQVFDFGEIDGEYFLAMEYVKGRSLLDVLKRLSKADYPKLPYPVTAFIVIELLKALHYAHTRTDAEGAPLNIVHRDISPDNLLISFEGDVKLVDFGVAKSAVKGRTETEPGLVKGKFKYFSPEQALAEPLDARSDLFTVGVVLYELLTGASLFVGQSHVVMNEIVHGAPPLIRVRAPDVPDVLADITLKALARPKGDRFHTARDMQEALSRWLFGQLPDFSGEVLRELMGELYAEELARTGAPFKPRARATGMLRALKSSTAPPTGDTAETKPGRPAVAAATPRRGAPWGVIGGLAAAAAVGAVVVMALVEDSALGSGPPPASVLPAAVSGPPQTKPEPLTTPQCQTQLEQIDRARQLIDVGRLEAAEQLLNFIPASCASAEQREARELLSAMLKAAPPGTEQAICAEQRSRLEAAGAALSRDDRAGAETALMFKPRDCTRADYVKLVAELDFKRSADERAAACNVQHGRVTTALAALDDYNLPRAKQLLAFKPMDCTEDEHLQATARMNVLSYKLINKPKDDVLFESAYAFYQRDDYGLAKAELARCLKANPRNAECHRLLGATLGQLGDSAGAAAEYEKFLKLAPNHQQAPKVRQLLEALKK